MNLFLDIITTSQGAQKVEIANLMQLDSAADMPGRNRIKRWKHLPSSPELHS